MTGTCICNPPGTKKHTFCTVCNRSNILIVLASKLCHITMSDNLVVTDRLH